MPGNGKCSHCAWNNPPEVSGSAPFFGAHSQHIAQTQRGRVCHFILNVKWETFFRAVKHLVSWPLQHPQFGAPKRLYVHDQRHQQLPFLGSRSGLLLVLAECMCVTKPSHSSGPRPHPALAAVSACRPAAELAVSAPVTRGQKMFRSNRTSPGSQRWKTGLSSADQLTAVLQ